MLLGVVLILNVLKMSKLLPVATKAILNVFVLLDFVFISITIATTYKMADSYS